MPSVASHLNVVLMTNFLPPYRISVLTELRNRFPRLSILISARTDPAGAWPPNWGELPVRLQRSLSLKSHWRHPHGFCDPMSIQIPLDTLPRLITLRPNVIIAGEMGARTVQAAIYRRLVGRARLVIWATVSEVTEDGRGLLRNWLRRLLLKSADAVIVNGESGARYIRRFGVDADAVFRAPQTTAIEQFSSTTQRPGAIRRRLLYTGRLAGQKGLQPFLLELAGWCRQNPTKNVEFWLVGDGHLSDVLASCPLPGNLRTRFLGHIPYERLPEIYREGGIFVFPTLADEWGLAVVEAMAAGLPVLGSVHSQAVEELVTDGYNGWVFRSDETESTRQAIHRAMCAGTDELDMMSRRAAERARDLTPTLMVERITKAIIYAAAKRSERS